MKKKLFKFVSLMLLFCSITLVVTSCSKDDDDSSSSTFSALFTKTDHFIDMLDTVYEKYDALGKKAADTSDGKFTVTPMGRLIIVKKKALASDITYSQVQAALETHYKNKSKVKDVFQNNSGTITIDCRK